MHAQFTPLMLMVGLMACSAAEEIPSTHSTAVRPGIDVLLSDSLSLVAGLRVGLVSNQAGVDAHGVHDVERLREAGVNLVALFSPEHGFRGAAAPGEAVAHSVDSATGLPIYSLYGQTSSPSAAMLEDIEVLLVDFQDAGARYYTYIYTATEVMRVAAEQDIPVVVLDRPNPIGGALTQGNVLDPEFRSAVGLLSVPMRHGFTFGELTLLARDEFAIPVALTVVPLQGWRRAMAFDQTGLPFIRPSPNLQTLESLYHYPGLCLFEGTALSVGRGTTEAFEQIGAPWLDTTAVLAQIRRARLPGVDFGGVVFTPVNPGDGKFANQSIPGIRLRVADRTLYDPAATAVFLLSVIQSVYPDRIGWFPAHFDRLAGGPGLREAIEAGTAPPTVIATWAGPLSDFAVRARLFQLY